MRIDHVDRDEEPLPGEQVFVVEFLVRCSEHTGGVLHPLRVQLVESAELGDKLALEWQAEWPASDLHERRERTRGGSRIVQRRVLIAGMINVEFSEPVAWRAVLMMEQERWPVRLRLASSMR
jgi:hypothetical protein